MMQQENLEHGNDGIFKRGGLNDAAAICYTIAK